MLLANKIHGNYVVYIPRTNLGCQISRDKWDKEVITRSNRWLCLWSGRYLAVLYCDMEAMTGRVTGTDRWITMMARSFRGPYEIGQELGEELRLWLKECFLWEVGQLENFWEPRTGGGAMGNEMLWKLGLKGEWWCQPTELWCKITSQIR